MHHSLKNRGSTLIEAVIALGVLAVAIPLIFGVFAESGKNSISAEAETCSNWIVPLCMAEIDASRAGKSRFFPATITQEIFPSSDDVWALGFSAEGQLIHKLDRSDYIYGLTHLNGQSVYYIASLSTTKIEEASIVSMLRLKIYLEYPANAPAKQRQTIVFYTKIP